MIFKYWDDFLYTEFNDKVTIYYISYPLKQAANHAVTCHSFLYFGGNNWPVNLKSTKAEGPGLRVENSKKG